MLKEISLKKLQFIVFSKIECLTMIMIKFHYYDNVENKIVCFSLLSIL